MKTCFWLLISILGLICGGCSRETSADSIIEAAPTPAPRIIRAKAEIADGNPEIAKTTESIFHANENQEKVYFVDKDDGWLVGNIINDDREIIESSLYKTENGGKNWTKVSIRPEKEAAFEKVVFVDPSVGWLTIQRTGDINENDTKCWLMKTTDGGKTWQNVLVQDFTEISDVFFVDEKNGFLTGEVSDPKNVYDSDKFLRKTADGGKTWTEIGANLFEKNGFSDARRIITGFIAETPEKLKVVMWSGKLFESADGGNSWRQFGPQFDFPAQTVPDNFGKLGSSARLRMARGTWSIEGIYSYIATEKNGDWTIRWTDEPLCIYDILFLSENEMVAVGRLGIFYEKNQERQGVVLYSSDAGANWKIIYRNKAVSDINSISKISENEFLAVGNKGLMVNVKLAK